MQALLNDPETIPFAKGNKICLRLLRKDITRRVVKIRSMIQGHNPPRLKQVHTENQAVQTQQPQFSQINSPNGTFAKALSPNPSVLNLMSGKDDRKYGKRSSLPVKKKHLKHQSQDIHRTKNKLTSKASDYLSIRKKLQSNPDSQNSSEKRFIQQSQDNKIFESKQFDEVAGFNGLRHSQNIFDHQGLHIPLKHNESDDEQHMNRSDYGSTLCRRNSNFGSKAPSVKKIRFTDRTAPEYEKRFVVSQTCQYKMLSLVDKMLAKNRKEAQDWNLRQNIIKKIDQKYSEHHV